MDFKAHHIFLFTLIFIVAAVIYDYISNKKVLTSVQTNLISTEKLEIKNIKNTVSESETKIEESNVVRVVEDELKMKTEEIYVSQEQKDIHKKLLQEANQLKNETKPFVAPREKGQPWENPYEINSP